MRNYLVIFAFLLLAALPSCGWGASGILAVTLHRSFRNGYPVEARTRTEKIVGAILPADQLNEAAGFFGPVTKKYLPAFKRFSRAYSTRSDKLTVVAEFLPTAEKALAEARKMRVPAKYEAKKAEYIRLFESALAAARLSVKMGSLKG